MQYDHKPTTMPEYLKWLRKTHGQENISTYQNYYDPTVIIAQNNFSSSPIWSKVTKDLKTINDKYLTDTGYALLSVFAPPPLVTKPYDSLLIKTFRKNVINNSNWPKPPTDGWIFPDIFGWMFRRGQKRGSRAWAGRFGGNIRDNARETIKGSTIA